MTKKLVVFPKNTLKRIETKQKDYATARKKLAYILLFTPADLRKIEPQWRSVWLSTSWKWMIRLGPG